MENLYTIGNLGDYCIFLPPEGWKAPRREEFSELPAEKCEITMPKLPVTGSFIYAHPPNYQGAEAFRFTRKEWTRKLKMLKELGVDTLIFQAALWNELGECYYPSDAFRDYKTWNVIEPALEAAAELNFVFYLGGYGSVTCWQKKLEAGTLRSEAERQLTCYRELMRYRSLFKGFYFAPESAFTGSRNPEQEKSQAELYRRIFSQVREMDSSLQILMSPATFYFPGRMDDMVDSWLEIFSGACPDILAPQDSIGSGCITMAQQPEALAQWHRIAGQLGVEHWSNVECFSCCYPFNDEHSRCAAPAARVLKQMANAEQYVSKLISWELLYYTDPQLCPEGRQLVEGVFRPFLQ